MINVSDLTYTYPNAPAPTLKQINFDIAENEIVGFLGPSGAGKSTTQKLLIALLKNYQGSAKILGKEVRDWDQNLYEEIGVSFELPNHYLRLTARENLDHFSSLYSGKVRQPDEVLEWVGLIDDADIFVADFSKGMKIRLNVARALIHQPKILFLDEPTSGLDPVNARIIRDLIFKLRDRGTTVFVTTHNMNLADELCDRVAFIIDGEIALIDQPKALKKKYGKREFTVEFQNGKATATKDFSLDDLGKNEDFLGLLKSGNRIEAIHSQETTLENIFIDVTGHRLV